jgi:ABC-type multidrug transport system ATPase subunit
MKRRLDLASALVHQPEVLFLDEPTTGLDPESRGNTWRLVRDLLRDGTTVLLTTHYLHEAQELADRIAVLEAGEIAAIGTADDLKRRIGGEVVALHDRDGALLREIPTDGTVAGLRAALADVDDAAAASITLRRPTLDDVFLALTGKQN